MQVCKVCVMDTTDPDIVFDAEGVCNHCYAARAAQNQHRIDAMHLPWIIDQIKKRGRGRKYDVLIGVSGGVDSATALRICHEQGLRILAYQVDNMYNTAQADENVMRLVEGLKVPFYRYAIDRDVFVEVQRAFIKAGIKNLEVITDHVLFATTYEMAAKYGIKTVITGGNWQTESIMPKSYGEDARDLYWIKNIYRTWTGKKLKKLPVIALWKEQYYRLVKKIKFVPVLDYYDYRRESEITRLAKAYGYRPYGSKHCESIFTHWFQEFYLPVKFGIDKRRPHLSSMIHSGQITRGQAMSELGKPLTGSQWNSVISEKLGMSMSEILSYPKKSYGDYPNSEKIRKLVIKLYAYAKGRG